MVVLTASPGPELRAQLVGLGYTLPSGGALTPSLPAGLKEQIQAAAAVGPSTGGGPGTGGGTDTGGAPPPTEPPPTNWLLWGGVGVGVLLLGALLLRR